jgi:hypothetical protein
VDIFSKVPHPYLGPTAFGEEVEVEVATGTVAKVEVEAGTAVLEVRVNFAAETAMFEEELGDARSLARCSEAFNLSRSFRTELLNLVGGGGLGGLGMWGSPGKPNWNPSCR